MKLTYQSQIGINKEGWKYYALIPFALIGNLLAYAVALSILAGLMFISADYLNDNIIMQIMVGYAGAMLLVISHILYFPIYDKLPSK